MMTTEQIKTAAALINVEPAALKAVCEVETRGSGFFSNGKPAILFERHIFRRLLIHAGFNVYELEQSHPELVNRVPGGYKGGVAEWARLEAARAINEAIANESCSWGAFQIMGYHFSECGFLSVHEFVASMCKAEYNHLVAFCNFIKKNRPILIALRDKDWSRFARYYNGVNYEKNRYDIKLAKAYNKALPLFKE